VNEKCIQGFWCRNLMGGQRLEELDLGGRIMLEWILKYRIRRGGMDCSGSGKRQVMGCCEHGSEISGSTIMGRISWPG
jgi:hypothetical protein